jgi:serine/threonine protein kinase
MKSCAHCGAEISGLREHGLCPACLLRLGLEPDLPTPDVVIDGETYRVLGPIGRGPNGTVYLGCGLRKPRRFATVKVIEQPIDLEVFLPLMHELLDRLPVSGRMHGAGRLIGTKITNDGRACVCAEYAPGAAVDQYFAAPGPSRERLEVLVDICELVAEVHQGGLAHGSIKAQNVIVVPSPRGHVPALLDVGVRPTIEASWRSRRAAREAQRPADVYVEARAADVDDLRSLVAGLLEHRTDIASLCGNSWSDPYRPKDQSAANMATELKSALGQMQGV